MLSANYMSRWWFNFVHRNHLVYNACWEDPRLDRAALEIGPDDTVLVITSGGCNALDYALEQPKQVYAVDVNPCQNALLELKIAGIQRLEFEEFFELFGRGRIADYHDVYERRLRSELSPSARHFWDRRIGFFSGRGRWPTFYYKGTCGLVAQILNFYIDRIARARESIDAILSAPSVSAQRQIYYEQIKDAVWTRMMRWFLNKDTTLSLVGVPKPQRQQIERHYANGVVSFVEQCVEAVFACLPLSDNYFWRVYLCGEYAPTCCPRYLERANFERLKSGLVDCISVHENTVEGFLLENDVRISRYVLLDHMDWLSTYRLPALRDEWQAIVRRATPAARVIWRSGALHVDFVDPLAVEVKGRERRVGDLLSYNRELAAELHAKDRVHTYGSFYIADLAVT